jgi:hypothetical protein
MVEPWLADSASAPHHRASRSRYPIGLDQGSRSSPLFWSDESYCPNRSATTARDTTTSATSPFATLLEPRVSWSCATAKFSLRRAYDGSDSQRRRWPRISPRKGATSYSISRTLCRRGLGRRPISPYRPRALHLVFPAGLQPERARALRLIILRNIDALIC